MFMNDIKMVEIGIFTGCNRHCEWCSNRFSDERIGRIMSDDVFDSIIDGLGYLDYSGTISFSRYNEPLMRPDLLLDKLRRTRNSLPKSNIVLNTNGDFLNEDILSRCLVDVDELTIMDYDNLGITKILKKLDDLGIDKYIVDGTTIYSTYFHESGKVTKICYVLGWNSEFEIEDRGGLLKKCDTHMPFKNGHALRDRPCHEPSKFLGIDANGLVMPCCNMRGDVNKHVRFAYGDLTRRSFMDIIMSVKRRGIIEDLASCNMLQPCIRCQKDAGRYTGILPGIKYKVTVEHPIVMDGGRLL